MAKAIITNRIFLDNDFEVRQKLLQELTYKIPNYRPELPPKVITNLRIVNEKLLAIPSGRVDLIPAHYEVEDRRNTVPVDFPEFKFTLRESQKLVYDQVNSDCFINAWTSWGKTFTGLAIAGKLGQKTLIIVHTLTLRDQWAKEVEKVYGFTPSIIGSGNFDTSKPITIANIQTLTRRNKSLYNKEFGTVIVDECHHIPAVSFSKVLDSIDARYKIGLSASNTRKDGLHILFPDFFSIKKFSPPKENFMKPSIHRVKLPFRVADGIQTWAQKINDLAYNPDYQKILALTAASYASKGHKVLVVGSRTKLLERASELTPNSVCVVGSTKDRAEKIQKVLDNKAKVLYGSTNIFSEGISVNNLSCLVLGTPMNNEPLLEQLIGRVIRKAEDKLDPVVVDLLLDGKTVRKQEQLRKGYYIKQGYKIKDL